VQVVTDIAAMQALSENERRRGRRIGLVPTMGYLHEGHLSLMHMARERSGYIIMSLFVNPLQFGPSEDFARYPRDLKKDTELASKAGVDVLFAPEAKAMYPDGFKAVVEIPEISSILEGKFRPTHFRGVTTVVMKLFNCTKPHLAVFGQKDAQQAFLIRKMVTDLNLDLEILVAPTVREPDGLALSSRNVYLNSDERERATSLYRSLVIAGEWIKSGERKAETIRSGMLSVLDQAHPSQIDYIAFVKPEDFSEIEVISPPSVQVLLAVRFGSTRLIDNMLFSV
jgi:pantoate--beta-alanine ligase